MVTVTPPSAPSSDVAALVDRVSTLQETQRAEDVEGFLALLGPDPVWVTGAGRRLVGREEIAALTRTALPGAMAGGTVEYRVEHVLFLTPDVAFTGVVQQYLDADGRPLVPPVLGSPGYVWQRIDGAWRLVVGQNTVVGGGEAHRTGLPLGPQLVGATEKTLTALLLRVLSGSGLSEPQWVTLALASRIEPWVDLADLADRVGVRAHFADADALVADLARRDLVGTATLTPAGRALVADLQSRLTTLTAPIWVLDPADVAAAERVLTTVGDRARRLLDEVG